MLARTVGGPDSGGDDGDEHWRIGQIRLPAVPPASVCCMVRSCVAPHIKKRRYSVELTPYGWGDKPFAALGEPRSGFVGQ